MPVRSFAAIALLPAIFIAAGCADRPSAPPLVNETVYQNDKLGLRFLPPEGWSIASRADLPTGPLPKPVFLVSYHQGKGDPPGELVVVAADLPEGADLAAFLVDYRIGTGGWVLKPPAEPATVNGVETTRFVLTRPRGTKIPADKASKAEGGDLRREANAFRRGGRVYFFVATFAASDTAARDAARQCVQGVTWAN